MQCMAQSICMNPQYLYLLQHRDAPAEACFSPGSLLVVAYNTPGATGASRHFEIIPEHPFTAVAAHPTHPIVFAGDAIGCIAAYQGQSLIWTVQTGSPTPATDLVVDPLGWRHLACFNSSTITLWCTTRHGSDRFEFPHFIKAVEPANAQGWVKFAGPLLLSLSVPPETYDPAATSQMLLDPSIQAWPIDDRHVLWDVDEPFSSAGHTFHVPLTSVAVNPAASSNPEHAFCTGGAEVKVWGSRLQMCDTLDRGQGVHSGEILCMEYSALGTYLLTCTTDSFILWKATPLISKHQLRHHWSKTTPVAWVTFTNDEQWMVVALSNGTISLLSIEDRETKHVPLPQVHSGAITHVACQGPIDGLGRMATAAVDHAVYVWHSADGDTPSGCGFQVEQELCHAYYGIPFRVVFTKDTRTLIVGLKPEPDSLVPCEIVVWTLHDSAMLSLDSWAVVRTVSWGIPGGITSLACPISDSLVFAAGGSNGSIFIIDAASPQNDPGRIESHAAEVTGVGFYCPDNGPRDDMSALAMQQISKSVPCQMPDSVILLLEPTAGAEDSPSPSRTVQDSGVRTQPMWSQMWTQLAGHTVCTEHTIPLPDGDHCVSVDEYMCRRHHAMGLCESPLSPAEVMADRRSPWFESAPDIMLQALGAKFARCPEARRVLLWTSMRPLLYNHPSDRFWGQHKGQGKNLLGRLLAQKLGPQGQVNCLAYSRDGIHLATAGNDKNVHLWSLAGSLLHVFPGNEGHRGPDNQPESRINAVAFAYPPSELLHLIAKTCHKCNQTDHLGDTCRKRGDDKGTWLVSATFLTIAVWCVGSRTLIKTISQGAAAIAVCPSGSRIAAGQKDGSIRLVTIGEEASGNIHGVVGLYGHEKAKIVSSVAFSPQGGAFASGGADRQVIIWREDTSSSGWGKPWVLTGNSEHSPHDDEVKCVRFSPSGSLLASCGKDCRVILWSALGIDAGLPDGTGRLLRSVSYTCTLNCLAFSPCSRFLVHGGKDGKVMVATVEGSPMPPLDAASPLDPGPPVFAVDWSPDGHCIASGGEDRKTKPCLMVSLSVQHTPEHPI
eukprot:gene5500-984_t